jgi:non-reducing end alpha-L-arabinofuranosidase
VKQSSSYFQFLHSRNWRAALALLAVAGIVIGALSVSGRQAQAAGSLPCDIYAAHSTPCVAAHSTVRALLSAYNGNLYQVKRASDGATTNIKTLTAGGYANAAAQDTFCAGTSCIITEIYDQSSRGNNLTIEGPGGAGKQDHGANASALPLTVGGHKVYGLYVTAGVGYRDDKTSGVAKNGQPEGMYMVASGTHVNNKCCFDYGNAETNNRDNGNGHMDAINFGTECWFKPCSGSGPWVQADMENGLFAGGNGSNLNNKGNSSAFVTALIKNNGQNRYDIKGGNAQSGGLTTWYNGAEPNRGGYSPMRQEGAIVLGTGGDNSNGSVGTFFEGVMTAGYPTNAADNAVQANIVSAGY